MPYIIYIAYKIAPQTLLLKLSLWNSRNYTNVGLTRGYQKHQTWCRNTVLTLTWEVLPLLMNIANHIFTITSRYLGRPKCIISIKKLPEKLLNIQIRSWHATLSAFDIQLSISKCSNQIKNQLTYFRNRTWSLYYA